MEITITENPNNVNLTESVTVIEVYEFGLGVTPIVHILKPTADGTAAILITKADGTTAMLTFDTTNNIIYVDGEIVLNGTATVFEDLRIPMTASKLGGSKDPGFTLFRNKAGSQGVFCYQFDKVSEEELYFAVQLPHSYKLGSTIYPHAHWGVAGSVAGGTTVRWGLEYTWVDIDGTFAEPTIIYTTATDPVTQYKHRLNSFTDIAGTGITGVSSMMLCRVFRDVANDNFDGDAALFEIDFHYEIDTMGSKTPTAK